MKRDVITACKSMKRYSEWHDTAVCKLLLSGAKEAVGFYALVQHVVVQSLLCEGKMTAQWWRFVLWRPFWGQTDPKETVAPRHSDKSY